jgi:hypothetical protein
VRFNRHTPLWLPCVALLLGLLVSASAVAEITFLVNSDGNTADENPGDGTCSTGNFFNVPGIGSVAECTLKAAIQEANEAAEPVRIEFADYIPVNDGITVILTPELPAIDHQVTIDGQTHPLYSEADGIPRVVLAQSLTTFTVPGLRLEENAQSSEIRGLSIINFSGQGIKINGGGDYLIENNWIGLYWQNGELNSLGNALSGIQLVSVEGADIANNHIVANGGSGIALLSCDLLCLSPEPTSEVVIRSNAIGIAPPIDSESEPAGNQGAGIFISAASGPNYIGTTFEGNQIAANAGDGIVINGNGQFVRNNRIGLPPAGGPASGFSPDDYGNGQNGIRIRGQNNTIGGAVSSGIGPTIGVPNRIGYSQYSGILIDDSDDEFLSADSNLLLQNFIGGDNAGTAFGQAHGIRIASGQFNTISNATIRNNMVGLQFESNDGANEAVGNTITDSSVCVMFLARGLLGGPNSSDANVIGNCGSAVAVTTASSTDYVQIYNNYIGTDASAAILPNQNGVQINGPAIVDIGSADSGNVIGNSTGRAIWLIDGANDVWIQGNHIGLNRSGIPLPNDVGIQIQSQPSEGAYDNIIGHGAASLINPDDWAPGIKSGNIIAYSNQAAVDLADADAQSTGNSIRGNQIFANGGRAIDLGMASHDDTGGTATGPNRQMNFPEFDSDQTFHDAGNNTIEYRYYVWMSTSEATYPLTIDLYLTDGHSGNAEFYLGSTTYPESSAQQFQTGSLAVPSGVTIDGYLAATATDSDGNTSQFTMEPIFLGATQDEVFHDRFEQ